MNARASRPAIEPVVAAQPTPMQVLVVEDFPANRMLLQAFLEQQGYGVRAVASGEEALAKFDPDRTDLVLLDVLMPGMDGIETTQRLRVLSDQRWVPVILMSPVSDQADIVRGLEAGADDYLVKPINLQVLEAKLRSFQRIADLHRQSEDNARILAQYRDQAEAELEIATSLIGAITQQGNLQDRQLTWSVIPSSRFSGDTVAALRTPSGRLLAMLADATGHGLPAAISLLPALEVFYGMAGKDLGLGEIVREINRRMWEHMPTGLYLAAVLLSVDMLDRSVEIWNGGMPPGLWVRAGSGVHSEALGSRHPPLGILGEESFDATSSRLEAAGDGHLVFYSDGLVEAINAEGEPFGALRLCSQLVGRPPAAGLRATIAALQAHLCGQPAQDDISVLMVGLD